MRKGVRGGWVMRTEGNGLEGEWVMWSGGKGVKGEKDYGGVGGWEEKRIGREKVMRRWGRG